MVDASRKTVSLEKPKLHFYIDIVGTCNLSCPSYPVGNSVISTGSRGVMSPSTLDHILEKASSECVVTHVGLFNWTEPLLHPRLDEMVRVVKKHGLTCAVSTNLNINKPERYRKLLESEPTAIRVSLSGFSQKTYSLTHRGGNIDDVKNNIKLLVQLKNATESLTQLSVVFHRYFSNMDEESKIKAHCDKLGVLFQPVNALMLPLEKVLAYCGETSFCTLNKEDDDIIENLLLPLSPALASATQNKAGACRLLEEQLVLNWKGDALLCCAVYDTNRFFVGNYLNDSLESIQAERRKHEVCSTCIKHGASNYFLYNVTQMDELIFENIRTHS
jgi:organic radical activating enzyme